MCHYSLLCAITHYFVPILIGSVVCSTSCNGSRSMHAFKRAGFKVPRSAVIVLRPAIIVLRLVGPTRVQACGVQGDCWAAVERSLVASDAEPVVPRTSAVSEGFGLFLSIITVVVVIYHYHCCLLLSIIEFIMAPEPIMVPTPSWPPSPAWPNPKPGEPLPRNVRPGAEG